MFPSLPLACKRIDDLLTLFFQFMKKIPPVSPKVPKIILQGEDQAENVSEEFFKEVIEESEYESDNTQEVRT